MQALPRRCHATFPPQDIVGRWGLAAYHKEEEDRARTEAAAANQCKQPYIITLGPTGGVMMHLADQATPTELRLKGAPGNKTYIGPEGEPGGAQDRLVVAFDGRVLILRWMDPEVQGRYGTMVYVRCGPEGASARPSRQARRSRDSRPFSNHPPRRDETLEARAHSALLLTEAPPRRPSTYCRFLFLLPFLF